MNLIKYLYINAVNIFFEINLKYYIKD